MALLKPARTAQNVMSADFSWTFADTMATVAGPVVDFGVTTVASTNTFEIIKLPPGAIIIGGSINRTVAFDTATYTVLLGDSVTNNRFLASADVKATGSTPLLVSGFRNPTGLDVRMTLTNADVCTTGAATVSILYVIEGRANEITSGTG